MSIRVLGISGSPRKGNSVYLLDLALEAARQRFPEMVETEMYRFRGKKMGPCLGCNNCVENGGTCIIDDDFKDLREKWLAADVIIYSVPVYHMSMPGQLKCFIDRLGNSLFGLTRVSLPDGSQTIPKLLKIVASIAQGSHVFSGQEHTITDLINHALVLQSIPVTADLWESYIGVGGWTLLRDDRQSFQALEEEHVMSAEATVRATKVIGRRAVELAEVTRRGLEASRELLQDDPMYRYVFDRLDGRKSKTGG